MNLRASTLAAWLGMLFVLGSLPESFGAVAPLAESLKNVGEIQDAGQRLGKLSALAGRSNESEIIPALKLADSLSELRERVVFREALFIRWAELTPTAAADAAIRLPASHMRDQVIEAVALEWVGKDSSAAWQWVKTASLLDPEKLTSLSLKIARKWVKTDPASATRWAATASPEPAENLTLLRTALESWAEESPLRATEYALRQSPDLRDDLGLATLNQWARQNPQAALQWLFTLPDEPFQTIGAPEIMRVWATVEPQEAARWVENLPPGTPREIAIHSYVDAACQLQPALCIALAVQFPDGPSRMLRVQQSLRAWLVSDPGAARKWIEQADFSENIKADWRAGNMNAGASEAEIRKLFKNP